MVTVAAAVSDKSDLRIENNSEDFLSAHWVDPRSGDTVVIVSDVQPRSRFTMNSFVGHQFQIWQERDPDTGLCGSGDEKCNKVGHFEVTKPSIQGEPNGAGLVLLCPRILAKKIWLYN